tara:strand:+ start:444 stop:839 length:396 start_codon:yes stop_codon:yes gene_type:complete
MSNKVHISQIDDRQLILEDGSNTLSAGGTLIGSVIQVAGYTHITGFAYSDVDSAAGGFIVEQGIQISDFPSGAAGSEFLTISSTAITGGNQVDNAFSVQIVAPFARIIYINGAVAQSSFRLYAEARVLRGL